MRRSKRRPRPPKLEREAAALPHRAGLLRAARVDAARILRARCGAAGERTADALDAAASRPAAEVHPELAAAARILRERGDHDAERLAVALEATAAHTAADFATDLAAEKLLSNLADVSPGLPGLETRLAAATLFSARMGVECALQAAATVAAKVSTRRQGDAG